MFRLALQMGRTVDELCETLTVAEFQQWVQFYSLEPFGSEAAFLRSGIVASTIANVNRDPKRKNTPWTPHEFVPQFGRKKKGLDQKLVRVALVEAFGGKVRHANRNDEIRRRKGNGVPAKGTRPQDGAQRGGEITEGGGKADSRNGESSGPGKDRGT